jgi:4'-phosphopantetheinyl transferase
MALETMHWDAPPDELALASEAVHVWRLPLEIPAPQIHQLRRSLDQDEALRASRFRFERDRRRFIVAHGLLRNILGQYLKIKPEQLQFHQNAYGKPALVDEANPANLRFNLTHSHELALLAVASGREIGIDLEYVHSIPDNDQIAAHVFSEVEITAYKKLPDSQRLHGFLNGWTRKEAYIKAVGMGLSRSLGDFDVSLTPGEPARLLRVKDMPAETGRWSMKAFEPEPGYIAALVVEGQDWQFTALSVGMGEPLTKKGTTRI